MARDEQGSVLLLVPASVLVLVVLGAIAVDFSLAFLGQRELTSAAAAAANDAAGAALSDAAFYGGGGAVVIDPIRAEQVAAETVRMRAGSGVTISTVSIRVVGPQVCVTIVGEVPYVFAPIVPGVGRVAVVRGQAVATAVVGETGSQVAPASGLC